MNDDLISRSTLIEKIESTDWYHISESGNLAKGANSELHTPLFKSDDIFTALDNAPAVEAVVPVRCKDCKHGRKSDHAYAVDTAKPLCECNFMYGPHQWREYCSWGERRADDE